MYRDFVSEKFQVLPDEFTPFYKLPDNYRFSTPDCQTCEEGFGGSNCAHECKYCLFRGTCDFRPTDAASAPCSCRYSWSDPLHSCCPFGTVLRASAVDQDVVGLSEEEVERMLNTRAGLWGDDVPSQKWCHACPGNVPHMHWAQSGADYTACGGQGDCGFSTRRSWMCFQFVRPCTGPRAATSWGLCTRAFQAFTDVLTTKGSTATWGRRTHPRACVRIITSACKRTCVARNLSAAVWVVRWRSGTAPCSSVSSRMCRVPTM